MEDYDETRAATDTGDAQHRRDDIDGLRTLAVAAVIAFHTDAKWFPGGFVGVDIFFVISGYVVAASLLRASLVAGLVQQSFFRSLLSHMKRSWRSCDRPPFGYLAIKPPAWRRAVAPASRRPTT